MNVKKIVTIVVVLAVLVGGGFAVRSFLSSRAAEQLSSSLTTEPARIGALEAVVGATGTVRAKQSVVLAWQTTGTVEAVEVSLGTPVEAGEVLASLKQSSLPQSVILAQADLVSAQNALEDMQDSFNPLAIAMAEKAVYQAEQALEDAQDHWDNINWVGTQEEINTAEYKMNQAWDDYTEAKEELDSMGDKTSRQYKMQEALTNQLYTEYGDMLYSYRYYTGNTVSELDRGIAEQDLEITQQQLVDAQDELARLQSGPSENDLAAAEARVAAAEASVELAWIESPFAGTITNVNIAPGDKVSVGTSAFRLDDLSSLLVNVNVSEVDINRVDIGQPVTLTFDAILDVDYQGEVIEVSPVGTDNQGVVNFGVTIEIVDPDARVKPGMTAAVNIVVSQLEDVLLVPNRAVRVVDGERVVYLMANGEMKMARITLGASSDSYSQVVDGDLQEGDEIILNPPADFFSTDGPPAFVRN
ncbi:efflux RND transporter periplasmic adaptor subunit [bacterium]|nr:efflux RND transporter periplasmic adaptor subunit [bacterium]MCB2179308.1 efflux RND transporter periplasmic adaptor subunit [bacterium]